VERGPPPPPGPAGGPVRRLLQRLWGEAFSPDSRLLAAAYGGGAALWDVARPDRPRLLTVLDAHVGKVTGSDIAFSPDGRLLALASGNGQVTIWNVTRPAHGFRVATMSPRQGTGWFTALRFAPRGALLAGVTTSGTVLVYNLDHPGRPARTAIRRSLVTLALFPDGEAATAGAPTGCPGCLVPSYALGFAPGGRALTVVMDRIMPDNSSRDTVLTWPVTASGALRDSTEAARNTWDGQPALAPDGRTVIDGQIFGGTRVRQWQVPAEPR
jgi:WD40 repeat protein